MSIPAVGWAIKQGERLELSPSERCLLMVLADMANGDRFCWALLATLARMTGIKQRMLIKAVQRLEACGLISTEPYGKSRKYYILRPVNGAQNAHVTHAPPAPVKPLKRAPDAPVQQNHAPDAPDAAEHVQISSEHVQNPTKTCAPDALRTLSITKKEPKTRVYAREAAQGQDSGGKEASEGQQALHGDVLPPPQNVPGSPTYDPSLTSDGQPRANAEGVHRAAMAAIRAITRKAYAPGRAPMLTPAEQIATTQQPDTTAPEIRPELQDLISAARRDLAQRAAQRQAVAA